MKQEIKDQYTIRASEIAIKFNRTHASVIHHCKRLEVLGMAVRDDEGNKTWFFKPEVMKYFKIIFTEKKKREKRNA